MGIAEGRARRDVQLALFNVKEGDFLNACRELAVQVAKRQGLVSINDIRKEIEVPPGVHPSVLGAVFKDKRFYVAGYTQAEHPGAHARIIRVYSLKERS